MYGYSAVNQSTFIAFFHLYSSFIFDSICAHHWSCSDQFQITPQTTVSLTTYLSHNQAIPSLMSQQFSTLFTTYTIGTHSEETWTHTAGILKFIVILLSSLYLSLQISIVPSCFLPTILCYSHFPIHCMSTVWSCLISLLLSFNTSRTESAVIFQAHRSVENIQP